jgi:membrane protease YdiL (CAAX protease family)
MNRKSVFTFLGITFAISWTLFLLPLAYKSQGAQVYSTATLVCFALAMWGPGIAAILTTLLVERQPFNSLRLNTLGSKRYYLWAWFLPPLLSVLAGILTLILKFGQFDPDLTTLHSAIDSAPGADQIDPQLIIGAQIGISVLLAPFINILFALGEELGWRGFLLPRLLPLGRWNAILISGFIWGFWHAPAILQGLNYPEHPIPGVFLMIAFCILLGAILSWLYFKTRSPWVAALGHGSVNASAGLSMIVMKPGLDVTLGGTLPSIAGIAGLAICVLILVVNGALKPVSQESA